MMTALGGQTVLATPPMVHHGFTTVWPPVTRHPASRAVSCHIMKKITFHRKKDCPLYDKDISNDSSLKST
jgi:hypothetical protein